MIDLDEDAPAAGEEALEPAEKRYEVRDSELRGLVLSSDSVRGRIGSAEAQPGAAQTKPHVEPLGWREEVVESQIVDCCLG